MQAACRGALGVSAFLRCRSTADIIKQTKEILSLDAGEYSDDATTERLEEFKTATKAYVADYRRLVSPAQKSFAETYGVITGVVQKLLMCACPVASSMCLFSCLLALTLPNIQQAAMLARAVASLLLQR